MKITVTFDSDGSKFTARAPYPGTEYVTCSRSCPHGCQADGPDDEPGAYHGAKGTITEADRDMVGLAICYYCRKPVGRIRVVFETLFGIEEDRRVLNGRARVY